MFRLCDTCMSLAHLYGIELTQTKEEPEGTELLEVRLS